MTPAELKSIRTLVGYGPTRVSRALAQRVAASGEGSAWRLRPPPSPEWPEEHWMYAVGPLDATSQEVLDELGQRYLGDWSPQVVEWEVERVSNPITPKQRRRLIEKAETGRMMFEDEEEIEEEAPRRGRRAGRLTPLPPGTHIQRLPPAAAHGATPFDWPMRNPAPQAKIAVYTQTPRRTWSLVDENTGMEIALVTGKRRRDALLRHLESSGGGTWQDLRAIAIAWKEAYPR